ncbi:type II toxin-antitoxin system VapC family toxin [Pseudonocardia sp. MH-G8]|uniref:type II toxin-antitoxin system VapC family toxin n=1 Tax=Pseudonocardia sp. MH-G8 TaxID=1854588 RepID=UPI000BA14B48|nr:type II toxin-antitoxin system VapC family toxin [Pseudonocardia sp. MH-G8]OZM83988.1 VapC toxin family PIN domain ribonuclease [Pseudonocardia sp. MH-G8]
MIYIDTSALLMLVKTDEAEGPALRDYMTGSGDSRLVSSALLAVEARRGILRGRPDGLPEVGLLLADVAQIEISDAVIESASRLPDPLLRSLDAIHLATALLIRDELDVLLSYDERLVAAAKAHDIPTASPTRP